MKSKTDSPITVRMAPSPTGNLHIGTARTTLYNFLFAKKNAGTFILRVEDTDKERSKKEYEDDILNGLQWLGLSYDKLYRQSERENIYKKYLKKMIEDGFAYVSKENVTEEGQRSEVIRFKNPNRKITFTDLIRGEVSFDTDELKDFVIARSETEPLYHLAVVIDDFEMGITHVIRGEDHISNTPRQILIQEAIGASRPVYAHIPLILANDRSKLSKRHGAVSIDEYRERGYLADAILNYLALLGWNPGTEQEIFTLEELSKVFDVKDVQKGGAIFDEEKLKWINKEHMKNLPEKIIREEIKKQILSTPEGKSWNNIDEGVSKIWKVVLERISRWKDVADLITEFDYAFKRPEYPNERLLWKDDKDLKNTAKRLEETLKLLQDLSEQDWNDIQIKDALKNYTTKEGNGNVLWPMRVALSGKEKSPDPFILAEILGKNETIERLKLASAKLI